MSTTSSSGRTLRPTAFAAFFLIAAVAAGGGFWLGTRHGAAARPAAEDARRAPEMPAAAASGGDAAAPATGTPPDGRKVLYWHDPMVPNARFDKPGKSPFMDMDLVPVYADPANEAGGVSISARQIQNFGVRTAAVTEGSLDTGFAAVGAVGIDERTLIAVQARTQGYVERLHARAQYDGVAVGQPLADLYVPEWLAAQEEWLALRRSPQPGVAELADAARERMRLLGMPDTEIARLERDGRPSARVTVLAPQAGIVWEIGARDGMAIMPGVTLFKLAAIGTVWVTADVPEAQAEQVRVGAPVEARVPAYPERVFRGSVNALLPEINAQTRTVRARIVLANPGGLLKPGMFATVAFGGAAGGSTVLVPAEALIQTGKRSIVLVDAGDGKFVPRDVETGRRSAELVEIRKGLEAGQRIVVSGQFLVDSEANLKAALARMAASAEAGQQPAGAASATMASPTPTVYSAEGVVRSVGSEILIRHGDIPAAGMGAMTMAFTPPQQGVPGSVRPGTRVAFEFTITPDGAMRIVSIAPAHGAHK
jgi:Cu(I)/Ag(I) efflux system membrane fusion protein